MKKVWYSKNKKKIEEYKYMIMQNLNLEDLKFREYMSEEEDNRKIENSIKKQYTNEGRKENAIEVAKRMKEKGFDISIIMDLTVLSDEEIKKI